MNDTDLELERQLRAHLQRTSPTDAAAPLQLRADILAIPGTIGPTTARDWRRRSLTLLVAATMVGTGIVGWATLVGSRNTTQPQPSPRALQFVVPSSSPLASSGPAATPTANGTAPAPTDDTTTSTPAQWQPAGSMSTPRFLHTATLLADGRVLVVGGGTDAPIASAEIWDPATGTFSTTGSMSRPRAGHAATLLHDGRVLVVGGDADVRSGRVLDVEVWDPSTGRFEADGTMPALPAGLTATTLRDGRVLIVGAPVCLVPEVGLPVLRDCPGDRVSTWLWSPVDGSSTAGPPPLEERQWHTATLLEDGRVLLVGNEQWGMDTPESAEVFDPATDAFRRVDEPRDYISGAQSATLLADGRVLVAGGDSADPNGDPHWMGPLKTAETWDPTSGTFSRAGSMASPRRAQQAVLLPDGRVIVVGGSGLRTPKFDDPSTATTELWDPATSTFTGGPEMAHARAQFTLTTLADGRLLAIGGDAGPNARSGIGHPLDSAEILDLHP